MTILSVSHIFTVRVSGGVSAATLGALVAMSSPAEAQTVPPTCPSVSTSCSITNQTVGDTTNTSSATGTNSSSSLSGTSAASNASNLTISPTNTAQTNQNSTNTTTGTISGGNTTSRADGGAATGNTTSANNQSSATSGGNTLGGASAVSGPSTSSVGATTATGGSVTGGANTTSAANTNSTGASTSTVDASNHSLSNEKLIFIPAIIPPTPPSTLAVGNIIKETGACGPLQTLVREPVEGSFFGLIKNSRVRQGYTEHLAPFVDEHGVRQDYRRVPLDDAMGYRLFGHQVTQYTTIVGVSGSRNIAIGGGGGNGAWGQGGAGASGSMQQMVTTIQLRECEVGSVLRTPPPPPPPPPAIYEVPRRIRQ